VSRLPEIIITEFMDEAAVQALSRDFGVAYEPDLCDRPLDLVALAGGARALIVRNRTQVRGFLLDIAARLECVGRLGVGLDNIDVGACSARGIAVYPARGANDLAVAEYVIAAALVLLRNSFAATEAVIAGHWPRQSSVGVELSDRTLGLIGFGAIARQVAAKARALGMRCVAHDPFVPAGDPVWVDVRQVELVQLLQESHVVSLHTPLDAGTCNLIDADALCLMQPDAILINAARGGIVDEEALVAALRDKRLGGAALDVFEKEPLDKEGGARFRGVPNLLLTPHIAGVTVESNQRVSELIAARVRDHLRGKR
jgi:(S)-sulfolactate dehydrogenase